MPAGAELLHGIRWSDVDSDVGIRYLGIHLGSDPAIQRAWETGIASRMAARTQELRVAGLPSTSFGRTTVIKTLIFNIANFFLMNQVPPHLSNLLDTWCQELWGVFWSTDAGDRREWAGGSRGPPTFLVRQSTITADHRDGGVRALAPRTFTDALRAKRRGH